MRETQRRNQTEPVLRTALICYKQLRTTAAVRVLLSSMNRILLLQ